MDRSLRFSGGFLIELAFMLLTLPLQWIIAAMVAAVFHELCHYAAIRLCAGKPIGVRIGMDRAIIRLPQMSRGKELFCALAGPVGGLLLCLFYPVFPRVAFCGLIQSLYNLLPVYPMDGGRALNCIASMAMKPTIAQWFCGFAQWLCIGAVFAAGIYAFAVLKLGVLPLLFGVALILKAKIANSPCKAGTLAVQ